MNDRDETLRTALGCCTEVTDTLLVEAFFEYPTPSGAEAVAALLSECGYEVTADELLTIA